MKVSANTLERAALLGHGTRWTQRLLPLASIACAAALSVWAEQAREPRAWLAALASVALGLIAVRRATREGRALGWGMAMVLASVGPHGAHRVLEASGAVGALACAAAASMAIARIPSGGGMVRAVASSPVLAVVAVTVVWWTALVARLAPPDGPLGWMTQNPGAWGLGAAGASMTALLAQAEWTLRRRRLEFGVVERAQAMRALLGISVAATLLVGVIGRTQADAFGRLVVALASAVVAGVATASDAVRVARLTRRVVVLAIAGGGVALVGASAVAEGGGDAWAVAVATAVLALAIGALSPALEAPLRPGAGAWLDAFERARAEALRADPEDAIREVLIALRAAGGPSSPSPELWTFAPPRMTRVDRAGYLHHRDAELPYAWVAAAAGEPEGTLRADVLDALEVRRPELRPLSKWMADHGALLVTVIAGAGEAEGVLVLPRVARDEPPTLEEVRALREVAAGLAANCRVMSAQARMLERANDAHERAEYAEEQVARAHHERALDVGRNALAAARLARPATVGGYSAASRMAIEALERRTSVGAPIAIVATSGLDPVPYLARAHLAGVRRDAPLVLVDATSAREHDLARWSSPLASPLALADRGMLVLLDGAALPIDVQQLVARALAEKRAPWDRPEPLDTQLAFTAVVAPGQLVAQGRLDATLALRLAEACASPVVLPRLRDRGEDLRSIITDRLAREGLRVLGRPVGIEQPAYARLIEHPFPGEDAELAVIVQRLVTRCDGDVVRAADVDVCLAQPRLRPVAPARSAAPRRAARATR